MASITISRGLAAIDKTVLAQLERFDLTGDVTQISNEARGHGGFAEVFKGRCTVVERGEIDIAVKRLRFHVNSIDCKQLFEKEIYVWSKLHHPNILPLLGFAFCRDTSYPLLLSEWMHNCTAWSYLQKHPDTSMLEIAGMAMDIASGLAYLHENSVIHADLKADNVLISADRRALICDFGCSRLFSATRSLAEVTTTTKGTNLFWAPELLDIDNPVRQSKATDVWAFGMTVYELICGKRPYEGLHQLQVIQSITRFRLPEFTHRQSDQPLDSALRSRLQRICTSCWSFDPTERPSMNELQFWPFMTQEFDDIAVRESASVAAQLSAGVANAGFRSTSMNTMSFDTIGSIDLREDRKTKGDCGKRTMVVREIVKTERTYVKHLQELVDIYVRPAELSVNSLVSVAASSKETVVPAAERQIVFGGLDALFTFHKESFLPALEAAAAPLLPSQSAARVAGSNEALSTNVAMAVGRIFVAGAAFMTMYSSYVNNFEGSTARVRQWLLDRPAPDGSTFSPSSDKAHRSSGVGKAEHEIALGSVESSASTHSLTRGQRKRIKAYLNRCRLHPRHSQLNLMGYLLVPIQRIVRYRLLLQELAYSTPPPDSYDDPIKNALTEIASLATNTNELVPGAESKENLVK